MHVKWHGWGGEGSLDHHPMIQLTSNLVQRSQYTLYTREWWEICIPEDPGPRGAAQILNHTPCYRTPQSASFLLQPDTWVQLLNAYPPSKFGENLVKEEGCRAQTFWGLQAMNGWLCPEYITRPAAIGAGKPGTSLAMSPCDQWPNPAPPEFIHAAFENVFCNLRAEFWSDEKSVDWSGIPWFFSIFHYFTFLGKRWLCWLQWGFWQLLGPPTPTPYRFGRAGCALDLHYIMSIMLTQS